MNFNRTLAASLALSATLSLVACGGGDQRSQNNVARSPFEGLWMGQRALADFTRPTDQLCPEVARYPSRHGLSMDRYGIPAVRIFKITREGGVYYWKPGLQVNGPAYAVTNYVIGRINADGSPARDPYGEAPGLGPLRLVNANLLALIAGPNPFRIQRRTKSGQVVEVRDAEREYEFQRVSEGQANAYLLALQRCAPDKFYDAEGERPTRGSTRPTPAPATPAPTQAAPTPPAARPAPNRAPAPAPTAPPKDVKKQGGYIPEDDWGD